MRIQKWLWWSALILCGSGSISLIADRFAAFYPPAIWWTWLIWLPTTVVSAVALRRCYRIEPSMARGHWHLRIEDLFAAAIYAALWMMELKPLFESQFLVAGVPFALLNAITLIIGLLAAHRRGIASRLKKFTYALGYGTRIVGLLGFGVLVAVIITDWLSFDAPFWWLRRVLSASTSFITSEEERWQIALHQMALLCLPLGVTVTALTERWIGRSTGNED